MMAIGTRSAFYLTNEILESNAFINFDEGGGELSAQISVGLYSMEELAAAVSVAMNAAGGLTYSVGFNRLDRTFTILADGVFDLLTNSGTQLGASPWSVLGFSTDVDRTGLTTYTGNLLAGQQYITQFPLQDFVGPDFNIEKIDPTINESASGEIETISFGDRRFIEGSLEYITNELMDGKVILNNPNGVADALNFLKNIIRKGGFEIMLDESDRLNFFKVKLDSTPSSRNGTGFKLLELTSQNLPGFYRIGPLKLRIIED